MSSSDRETLWARCREMEAKQNYAEAFKAALHLQRYEPKNEEILETLRRLSAKMQLLANEANSTENRVTSMLKYLKDGSLDVEKRVQAANNLVALLKDNAGRKLFIEQKGFDVITDVMRDRKIKPEIRLALIRVLTQLSDGNEELAMLVLKNVGLNFLIDRMASIDNDEQYLTASQTTIQMLITTLSRFNPKDKTVKRDEIKERIKKYEKELDSILEPIIDRINQRNMTGECRDTLLELLMVNIDPLNLDYGKKVLDRDGLYKLLDVASELEEIRYESSMNITHNTRTHVALVLDKVFDCMYSDKAREEFYERMMAFMGGLLRGPDIENKVRATAAITSLLNGPIDAGNYCLGQQGIIEMMLAMANSDDTVQQCVAAEAIIAAASKKDKGKSMASMGTGILKTLYNSNDPKIKVRALVGLCKLGSTHGTDASSRVYDQEATMKLLKACSQILCADGLAPVVAKDAKKRNDDIKKWAADGLAYLSLDADVKEALIKDKQTLTALVELGRTGDLSVLFGVVTTFVNLTNSYDKADIMPELKELAKFSKQHVPEEHEFDAKQYSDARCKVLAEAHITTALVSLARSQAKTCREMISRVFNALCEFRDLQGIVIQEGGARVLIKLATENNTDLGAKLASQALARIAIHNNPEIAFPGQRSVEVVKPIMDLLHPDCSGLQNFEALMGLTNLVQVNVAVRNRILKDNGFSRIEQLAYEEHTMIKRAAVQCITNLVLSDQVVKYFEGDNDRVKFLVLTLEEDDLETVSAAAGALAMLTSVSKKSSQKVIAVKDWLEILVKIVSSTDTSLAHRGVAIVYNLLAADSKTAEVVVASPLFELLMAIVRPEVDDIPEVVKNIAKEALKLAEEQKLIKNVEKLGV